MKLPKTGVTLLELLVALVIVSILSSIAVSVYTGQVERARYARARDEIRQLELACHRYEIDVGQFPPSGSQTTPALGSGWLQLTLLHSLSGDAYRPIDFRWQGPYVDFDYNQFGDINGNPVTATTAPGDIQLLDPWRTPYLYIRFDNYATLGGTQLPDTSPYKASETYYNPTTFQIISFGHNRTTLAVPNRGLEADDVTNFIGSEL
jgi:prepilin-type N-terminal cleavage/methylation domain-containing protein